ncbi:MAG: cell wall metabolism sensor histidine kinase WalK [Ruminococcaceae bacterium]|nr:cell wall metabolism sensor histidine kinase WalK [Oscillospiraceae bacterium]
MLLTMVVFSYYIINSISGYLYRDERVNVSTTANMISSFAGEYFGEDNQTVDQSIDGLLETLKVDEQARILLINKDSAVLFDSQHNPDIIGKAQVKQSVITALGGKEGYEEYKNSEDGTLVLDASVPINHGGAIIGAVNVTYTSNKINTFVNEITRDIALLFVVIFFLVGLIIFLVVSLITRRIVDFTKKITDMSDGVLDEKLEVKGHDEIAQLGEAFNNMSEKLALLEEKRLQFVSDASHELKTPLSSIKLIADSIMQTPDIDMDYLHEFLNDMVGEVNRLNRIVNKLLYITKMDSVSNADVRNFELLNLKTMVGDIVKNLRPLAEYSNIEMVLDAPEDVFTMADKDRLWQGIYNICDNAIKYTREYGKVEITLSAAGTEAVVSVRDNGVGLTAEDREKIFDRFYRVDKARARATGGTGLGLSIALSAVQMHGGRIEVDSELNMGSEFRIILPLMDNA